jgi:eukaryotic-like serine/threonine-protein kinase
MRTLDQHTRIGRTIGHFRIIEEVGAGGMGVVYRAHDQHLDREVAVKVLAPGTLKDRNARKRFREEARAISKLNHANIATVHAFDSDGTFDYLVMEYVPGQKLRDRIYEGPLPEPEIIRLATQLANGLGAAHSRGLVHRDLKPENVRFNLEGQLKILDFGLAKLVQSASDSRTTESDISAIAGTLAYMSPEQLRGGVVDQSSDLFSFGIVLYEMATGSHPFFKEDPSHVLTAILHQQPNPPAKLNSNISAELERIILKCLEKEPENRYSSAKEIAADLLQSAFPGSVARRERAFALRKAPWKTIAAAALALGVLLGVIVLVLRGHSVQALTGSDTVVLAEFANRTGDSVFDDALNQALAIELEQSPFLKIVPQSKTREMLTLMGRSPDQPVTPEVAREVCQRTGGKAVLSGSISSLGTDYVIGLRATECSSGNDLANEQAQFAKKESVLKVLGKAASHLRSKLGESLSSLQKFDTPLEQATTPSLEALKAYSLGRKAQYQQGNSAAIPFFNRAVALDANFAVAYSGLGIVYSNLGEPGLANDNFQRAYDLRERVSEREKLRIAAAYHSYFDGDLVKGAEIYELWAQAYPRDSVPSANLGAILSVPRRVSESSRRNAGASAVRARQCCSLHQSDGWIHCS